MAHGIFLGLRRNLKVSAVLVLFLFGWPLFTYAYQKSAIHGANLARDIQLLLSLKGLYAGPVDGQCDKETKLAIEKFETVVNNGSPSEANCNAGVLSDLKNDVKSILIAGTLVQNDSASRHKSETLSTEIDDLKVSIINTNAALKGITDGFATNLLNQYNSLASIGLTAFVAAIYATIGIIALTSTLLREFITNSVKQSHDKLFDDSKINLEILQQDANSQTEAKLTEMVEQAKKTVADSADIAHTALLTQIYGRLGGQIIYLYKDLAAPHERHRSLFFSYLRIGAHIAKVGNQVANKLVELYGNQEIPPEHKQYVLFCRNNFVFYVSSANDKYLAISKDTVAEGELEILERDEDDVKDVELCIAELEETVAQDRKNSYWLDIKDTIIWAKLSLGITSPGDCKAALEGMVNDTAISREWKRNLKKRYDFYDKFDEHTDKICLHV
jgi:hypothetical protein